MLTTSVISGLSTIFIGIIVVIGVFAMVREIVLWYFRINESVQVAKESRDYLRMLVDLASEQSGNAPQAANPYPTPVTMSGWRDSGKPKPKDTSPIWRENK